LAEPKPNFPLPDSVSVSVSTARCFALAATGLVNPVASIAEALAHLGFIQIDPLNVCGRMHEHILRNRVINYAEGDLHTHLYGIRDDAPLDQPTLPAAHRTAFEHFHPGRGVLAAFPLAAWPYFYAKMARRARTPGSWMGKLTAPEKRLADTILAEITARGPLGSEHILDDTRASNGWNNSRLAKVVMDKLLGHGRLLISRRFKGRRIYDLPERIIPSDLLARPDPTPAAITRWTALLKLQQHRLVTLTRAELPSVIDDVLPLKVDDGAPLYCLKSDRPLLDSVIAGQIIAPPALRLLAPLDPLIIDRVLVQRLWNFDYTWEVYTPAAKRKRGYYALPLLASDQLIGHADLKFDRSLGKLKVLNRRCPRPHRLAPAVANLQQFLTSTP
jgi:uncharacterized protein YcaQ